MRLAYFLLIFIYYSNQIRELKKLTNLSAKKFFDEGNNAFALGRLIDAKELYKKTIVSNPNFLEGYYNLGITYKKLGKFKKAEQKFKDTITINSKFFYAYKNLCSVLQVQKI